MSVTVTGQTPAAFGSQWAKRGTGPNAKSRQARSFTSQHAAKFGPTRTSARRPSGQPMRILEMRSDVTVAARSLAGEIYAVAACGLR
jgi:hypothetical protein